MIGKVLGLIKNEGPLSANQIALQLSITGKQARSAIDRLRVQGEPIWNDGARGAFWWSSEYPIGSGWKRAYDKPALAGLPEGAHYKAKSGFASSSSEVHIADGDLPMRSETWAALVYAGNLAHWARPGVFATAVGDDYEPGSRDSILYVGKSMGALGEKLALGLDQAVNAQITRAWMQNWRINNPRSAFWQVADELGPTTTLAWTNILKIDVPTIEGVGRGRPPTLQQTKSLSDLSERALSEELQLLRPKVALFVTSAYQTSIVQNALRSNSYAEASEYQRWTNDLSAHLWKDLGATWAVLVDHPQGKPRTWRDKIVRLIRQLRSS